VVTFSYLYAGIAGLAAVLVANLTAVIMGMNREKVISGAYGFNALMVGAWYWHLLFNLVLSFI